MALARGARGASLVALLATACRHSGPPYSPGRSQETFRLEDGYTIELVAAEPQLASPVALAFDEDGRMFVAEMPGYPLDTGPTGRIRLLEDRDGDGRVERSTVFADGLVLPTGVMRYRQGVLVTAAPDVWYLEDADGDGKAEKREKILTGFAFSNPQHTVNSPVVGLDNWIHLAHEGPAGAVIYPELFGDRGSPLRFPDKAGSPEVAVGRHAVRFRPETLEIEAHSGRSQFGHAFDEWGRYLTLDNSNHARHEVIASRYLKRNPGLATSAMQNVSDHGSNAKVYAITRNPRFELLTEPGEFTSACGMAFDTGGLLSRPGARSGFVAEPAQNLVHRDLWSDRGSTFVARRAQEGREFLASTDSWFRPVYLTIGPDASLYVVDYYRQMIEHPEWASTHVHNHQKGLYAGQDRGRLWRIRPAGAASAGGVRPRLGTASDEELVAALAHENGWWRRTAQRLLVERRRTQGVPLLLRLFADSPKALARLHALWTLEGLGGLDEATLARALSDPEPGVRENAIILSEPRLARAAAGPSPLAAKVQALADDDSPKVRFQLLAALGSVDSPAARAAQEKLLLRDLDDEWVQVAALSASPTRAQAYLKAALATGSPFIASESPARAGFLRRAAGAGAGPEGEALLVRLASVTDTGADWWRAAVAEGLARGAQERGPLALTARGRGALFTLAFDRATAVRRAALQGLSVSTTPTASGVAPEVPLAVLSRAEALAVNAERPPDERADALRLLAILDPGPRAALFERLIDPRQPDEVQVAAVSALGRIPGDDAGKLLLQRWSALRAPVRNEAAEVLLAEPGRTRLLVAALQRSDVQPWALSFWQKRDLIMHHDPGIRALARPLLEEPPAEREKVLKRYEAALELAGDPARGRIVFDSVCARCHRLDGQGGEIGPDLGSVRNKAPTLLLGDILLPSRAIAQNYESYAVETTAGETLEGVVVRQTPATLVLRRGDEPERVVSRAEIKTMQVSPISAMPADLDQTLDVRQMADLLALLTSRP